MSEARKEILADGIEVWLGDCREILPALQSIDHIITDPPYEDELHAAIGRIRRNDGQKMIESLGFEGIGAIRETIVPILVSSCGGWLIVFTLAEGVRAWRDPIQAAGGKWDTTLAWVKPDSSPRFNGQGAARGFECAITAWCAKGYRKWNGGGRRGVFTHPVNYGRQGEHPTEKPVPLMMELVQLYSDPQQTICDPFMGSGTTGVACVKSGRKFIGIEQSGKWFELSIRRISDALKQPDMFVGRIKPEKQQAFI